MIALIAARAPDAGGDRAPRHRPLHGVDEMFVAKRLGDEIESAFAGHADRRGNAAVGGDDDDRQLRIEQSQALQHLVAAEVGHPHVQEDRVRVAAGRHFEADSSGRRFGDVEPGVRQDIAHDPSHVLIVVDDEDNGLLAHQDGLRNDPSRPGGRGAGSRRRRLARLAAGRTRATARRSSSAPTRVSA